MVVADLYFMRPIRTPDEADPPLVVDADAPLSRSVPSEPLETIPRWPSQILEPTRCIQQQELSVCLALDPRCQSRRSLPLEDPPRLRIPEAADHAGRLCP